MSSISSQNALSASSQGPGAAGGATVVTPDNPFDFARTGGNAEDGYVSASSDLTDDGEYDNNMITNPPNYFYPTRLPRQFTLYLDEFGRLNGERATL